MFLNTLEYPNDIGNHFGFRSRYLGNYLGRYIKPLKFKTERFNAIIIEGRATPPGPCCLCEVKALSVPLRFDRERYEALGPNEHHEFFIGMLNEGLEKCVPDFKIPIKELREGIEEFRRGGYKNEWTHQSKLLRPHGVRASLLCKLDSERFVLTLLLERKGKTIFKESILEEYPDETCFRHSFKEVISEGDDIVVKTKWGEDVFRLDVRPLLGSC
jgi:hypothetical protein